MSPKVPLLHNNGFFGHGPIEYSACSSASAPYAMMSGAPVGYRSRPSVVYSRCEYCGLTYPAYQAKCEQGCGAALKPGAR
jgi:hypothetical protein